MKKFLLNIIGLVLAPTLIASLLGGCGSASNTASTNETSAAAVTNEAAGDSTSDSTAAWASASDSTAAAGTPASDSTAAAGTSASDGTAAGNSTSDDIAAAGASTSGSTAATEDSTGGADNTSAASDFLTVHGSGEETPDDAYRTCYEIFVYSFCDSNGDGIGDLNGITSKLDYINDGNPGKGDDLECSEIWLTPVFPSPTYHKYDATDYESIDPSFGTLEDYENLLEESHKRGIRVLMDLAVNHTSTEHPWFQAAAEYLKALPDGQEPDTTACPYVAYYNFSKEAQDGYAQLEGTNWYYEARFWSGMPDLNLDSEQVRSEIKDILLFWQEKGVDGFRLDAITSYYTEDQQATADFLQWLVQTAKENDPDCYLVGEAWEDQSAYAKLYSTGIDSLFDFQFAGQDGIIAGTTRGSRKASYYASALTNEEQLYAGISDTAINAPFYTNHDIARSAGYYTKQGESRVKLAEALNLLQSGNAFLYYGEEIGMKGSGKDENKRAPMYWTAGESDDMCQGPPDMDEVTMKYPALDEQLQDANSIVRYIQKAIRIRNAYPVIPRGTTQVADSLTGEDVAAFVRVSKEDTTGTSGKTTGTFAPVLIVINTSDEPQTLDLEEAGAISRSDDNEVQASQSDASVTMEISSFQTLSDTLDVSSDDLTTLEGTTLTLAPFGIAILTQ